MRTRRLASVILAAAAAAALAGCDWLLGVDTTPPACRITSPVDSTAVTGVATIAASATDTTGVERVDFFADGALVGSDSSSPYAISWDVTTLPESSWHSLSCVAYDLAGNAGYSDTIAVLIGPLGPQSIYHGMLDIGAGATRWLWFSAAAGDTVVGDVQVVVGDTLAKFVCLDSTNHRKFLNSEPYTALFEADQFVLTNLNEVLPSGGKYYIAFVNSRSATVTCWARLTWE